jgi:hypothetical protein
MKNCRIEKIVNGKDSALFDNLKEASNSIDTRMDNWKVQLCITNAINNKSKAFGAFWRKTN